MSVADSCPSLPTQWASQSNGEGCLDVGWKDNESPKTQKKVFNVERVPWSLEPTRKRVREDRCAALDEGCTKPQAEGMKLRKQCRKAVRNGYSPQYLATATSHSPSVWTAQPLPADPRGCLQSIDGPSLLAALQRAQTRCTSRIDRPPGAAFWAYMSAAFFTEEPTLPTTSEQWLADLTLEQGTDNGPAGMEWGEMQRSTERLWEDARRTSSALFSELRDRLPPAVSQSPSDADPWASLIHSAEGHIALAQCAWQLDHSPPAAEGDDADIYCDVCADGGFTPDNEIVICSGCGVAVHMRCYGLDSLSEEEWYCEPCTLVDVLMQPVESIVCSICLRTGGILRSGVTLPVGATNWAHAFCVETLPGAEFSSYKSSVDLSHVDPRRSQMRCQLCDDPRGACVQCSFRSCLSAFHPGCWKATFVQANGAIDSYLTCIKHRDSTLTQKIHKLEKTRIKEVQLLVRELVGYECVKKPAKKSVSHKELKELMKAASRALRVHNVERRKLGFHITVDARARTAQVDAPRKWTLLAPDVFQSEQLSIAGRSPEESAVLYRDAYSRIRNKVKPGGEFGSGEAETLRSQLETAKNRKKKIRKRRIIIRIPLKLILGVS